MSSGRPSGAGRVHYSARPRHARMAMRSRASRTGVPGARGSGASSAGLRRSRTRPGPRSGTAAGQSAERAATLLRASEARPTASAARSASATPARGPVNERRRQGDSGVGQHAASARRARGGGQRHACHGGIRMLALRGVEEAAGVKRASRAARGSARRAPGKNRRRAAPPRMRRQSRGKTSWWTSASGAEGDPAPGAARAPAEPDVLPELLARLLTEPARSRRGARKRRGARRRLAVSNRPLRRHPQDGRTGPPAPGRSTAALDQFGAAPAATPARATRAWDAVGVGEARTAAGGGGGALVARRRGPCRSASARPRRARGRAPRSGCS